MHVRKYQLYTDSLVHDEAALKYLVATVGVDNVVLGSDYPFPLGEHHPGKLIESVEEWDQETKVCIYARHNSVEHDVPCLLLLIQEKLLSGNAFRLLNLNPEQYKQ